ncbi:MAG: glyceraldehyde-3-phosphate dehydrogenase, partial [Paracoccaceae bacterium]|nr:glyceraldehyde-3-phosphate dehydrogenase [Paracoccaceae bacterium]
MTRIALNGFGRIGKLLLRALADQGLAGQIVLLNDPAGSPEQHALLMEFDSVHGRWRGAIAHDAESLTVNGQRMQVTAQKRIEDLPLAALGIDLVLDCTGVFKTADKVAPYYAAGVKKVIVSAPVKDGGALNLVYGVNHHLYDPAQHDLVTAASCTTNCLAPVVQVLH